jgi:amidophosphoribosyltransferase
VSRLVDALYALEGAYCLVLLAEDRLVAVRDPFGFRPLVLGRREGAWVVASETCALDLIDATYVREVAPGEMLIIDREGIQSLSPFPRRPRRACIFEQIYFARPDSVVFGRGVYETRVALGRRLAVEHPVEADLVIGVPDSGLAGAVGFAQESGLSFQHGLLRSHHVGRTFIEPSPQIRDLGVRLKLSPVRAVLAGRRVVVVDDSIVRGTTSRKIVRMIREAGAAAVHMRITAPPMTGGCHYGVDTPDRSELIAHRKNPEEIGRWIGADSVGFLSLEGLRAVEGAERGWCEACFSGDYPIQPSGPEMDSQVPLFPAARQPRDA